MTRVAVTTDLDAAQRIGRLAEEADLEPVFLPCIRVVVSPQAVLDPMREAAAQADWLVFTSRRAVTAMWPSAGMPERPVVAAVGAATAPAFSAYTV